MDGPWQIGHMPAVDYGKKAAEAAIQMRKADSSIQLVACGSSSPLMPTYLEWDRQVLEQCYNEVDAISLHRYFNKPAETSGDSTRFLALNLGLEQQIDEVAAVCDFVRARLRSRKRLWLSFDEWNVWYRTFNALDGKQQEAPHLVEEIYSLEDALLVGGTLNSLLRKAARVRVACLAQLVNVIAPLMTDSERVLRQTIYYPYLWALKYARGKVLDLPVKSATYEAQRIGPVPFVDAAGTYDSETGRATILLLNRDLEKEREATLIWQGAVPAKELTCQVLTGPDLKAANTFDEPARIVPQDLEPPTLAPRTILKLPARSYSVLHLEMGK
jgi:alpha-N-arabinofuranosidase